MVGTCGTGTDPFGLQPVDSIVRPYLVSYTDAKEKLFRRRHRPQTSRSVTRIFPPIALALPFFLEFKAIGLTDTPFGLIVA